MKVIYQVIRLSRTDWEELVEVRVTRASASCCVMALGSCQRLLTRLMRQSGNLQY